MSKAITRIQKYKHYRQSIKKMTDFSIGGFSPDQEDGTIVQRSSWLYTIIIGIVAVVSIIVVALMLLGGQ
jgi:hypothetical protein